jgi:pyrroloquinoline quinone biosynthesis protein E
MPDPDPLALLAELTHACPLHCAYCSNPVELVRRADELQTEDWLRVLSEAAALGILQVHFSGGEPLLRPDLERLVRHAVSLGLYPYLVTSGVPGGAARLAGLREAGLRALQISLQHAEPERSDALAGAAAFDSKRAAVAAAKSLGLHVTLNIVLERRNASSAAELIALAASWGVERLELAHVQGLGWAHRNRAALAIDAAQLDAVQRAVELGRRRHAATMEILHVLPDGVGHRPPACLQGWGRRFLVVAPDGAVLPCHAARSLPGLQFADVRTRSLDWIWNHSPAFERFRGTAWMREPCRSCEHRERDFGGCRCQAFLLTGDAAATDPACPLSPHAGLAGALSTEPVPRRMEGTISRS